MSTEADLGIPRENRWLGTPNKSHYIPGWYTPHSNLELEVKHLGLPQGFKIKQTLPFRRWALDEQGNTIDQNEFNDQYVRYVMGYKIAETSDPRNEAIPNVLAFIRMKYDAVGSLVDINYNDDGRVVKEEKYTEHGEIAPEFLLKNQEQSDKLSKLSVLNDLVRDGVLTPDQFQAKAAELLGSELESVSIGDEPVGAPYATRGRGRPKGSKNRPKAIDYHANP